MKIRVTIDTDDCDFASENENSYNNGVVSISKEGVARWWYHSPSYFVPFKDVEVIDCNHKCGYDKEHNCFDCHKHLIRNEKWKVI